MSKKIDLTGRRFSRLLVLYESEERKGGRVTWHCRCDCGTGVDVTSSHLISGHTTSCGCYNRERVAETHTVHGMARQGERYLIYGVWKTMLHRCENPSIKHYKDYGGRGITVCDEWHDAQVFTDWALANGWRKGLTLDRIDNDGNYEPSNCHWVTWKEQARNKRNSHFITFNGKTRPMAQWAEEIGIDYPSLWRRICQLHWPIERALTEPIRGGMHPLPG